jgi:uncharacterized protein with von Willebrand factor type A (vWA) domain
MKHSLFQEQTSAYAKKIGVMLWWTVPKCSITRADLLRSAQRWNIPDKYVPNKISYSVIQAVLNNVENLPGVSVDLKHNFGRELLTRIKSRDDRKFHNPTPPELHEVWKEAFHLGLTASPRWEELLEKSQSFGMEQNNHAELCAIAWLLQGLNCPKIYHSDTADLSTLQRQIQSASRLGIASSAQHQSRVAAWEAAYRELNEILVDGDRLTDYCKHICNQAVENALESLEFSRSGNLTGDMPGMSEREQATQVATTVKYSQPHIRKILNMMGKMRGMFGFTKTNAGSKKESARCENGNDISRLVLDEHCKDEDQFYLEFAERKLSQYRNKASSRGSGPVILLIDETGSMNTLLGHESRYVWAKAFALMVSKASKKQNRECLFIGFGGRVCYTISNKDITHEHLDEFMMFHSKPSTRWKPALSKALKIISSDATYKKADVILLTDGEDRSIVEDYEFLEKLAAEKKRIDHLKVHGILVGSSDSEFAKNLAAVSDVVIPVNSFEDTANLNGIIKGI